MKSQVSTCTHQGFTLTEVLIVIFMMGVLAAIATPSWLAFIEARRLSVAQDQVYRVLREAQSHAKREKMTWQASFRESDHVVQWAIHPANATPTTANWQSMDSAIRIVDTAINSRDPHDTTLYFDRFHSLWRIQFNYKGHPNGQLGKITLSTHSGSHAKRCAIISTLIGAMRTAQDEYCSN